MAYVQFDEAACLSVSNIPCGRACDQVRGALWQYALTLTLPCAQKHGGWTESRSRWWRSK